MVSGAGAAKGRSSSHALNRLQTTTLPYVLGSGIYLAPLWVSSLRNPADDPTRQRQVRPPCRDQPSWWHALAQGDFGSFDIAVRADALRKPKPLAGWYRILFLCSKGFDSTLGCTGEGPRPRRV